MLYGDLLAATVATRARYRYYGYNVHRYKTHNPRRTATTTSVHQLIQTKNGSELQVTAARDRSYHALNRPRFVVMLAAPVGIRTGEVAATSKRARDSVTESVASVASNIDFGTREAADVWLPEVPRRGRRVLSWSATEQLGSAWSAV